MNQDRTPRPGDLFRHFKGNLYQIITVAKHSESEELLVIYQALYGDYKTYARPLEMFLSEVDKEKYKDVEAKYRFEKVARESLTLEASESTAVVRENLPTVVSESTVNVESECPTTKNDSKDNQPISEDAELNRLDSEKTELNSSESKEMINSDLLAFLDARDSAEKLEILYSIRSKMDDRLMTNIEMSLDLSGHEGTIEERINLVKNNLQTLARFECKRLR